MSVLYSGPIHLEFHQVAIEAPGADPLPNLAVAFEGQANGLCGAALPNYLHFYVGLHTGTVQFEVQLHDAAPPADETADEIVEVNFHSPVDELLLFGLMANEAPSLALPAGDWRVRFHAFAMQDGHDQDTTDEDGTIVDSYLVQFWPTDGAPCRIVKHTSRAAANWHKAKGVKVAAAEPAPAKLAAASSTQRPLPGAEYVGQLTIQHSFRSASGRFVLVQPPTGPKALWDASADGSFLALPPQSTPLALQDGRLLFVRRTTEGEPHLQVWNLDDGESKLDIQTHRPRIDGGEVQASGPWVTWRSGVGTHQMVVHQLETGETFIGAPIELAHGPNGSILTVMQLQAHSTGAWLLHNIGERCHMFDSSTGQTNSVPIARDAKGDGRGRLVWRAPPPGVPEPVHTMGGWVGDRGPPIP